MTNTGMNEELQNMILPSLTSLPQLPPQIMTVPKEEVAIDQDEVEKNGGVNNMFPTVALAKGSGENGLASNVKMYDHLAPLAEYKDVIADKELFKSTLLILHKALKTKFG